MSKNAITFNQPALTCALTKVEFKQRRALLHRQLRHHIASSRLHGRELSVEFKPRSVARSDLEYFVELERQCCGFLNFTISALDDTLTLQITAAKGSELTLALFADSVGASQ